MPQGGGLFRRHVGAREHGARAAASAECRRRPCWDDEQIFEFFPRIKRSLASPADYLSGGEQQMVAVARALSGDISVLLLDEPFEGLVAGHGRGVFEAFDKLRREISILIVDHHLDLALALSDRTVVLERGQVTMWGRRAPLLHNVDFRKEVLWV